jgi:2-methylcitrate synthase
MELCSKFKTPQEAREVVKEMLARKEKIMGFGHAVYRSSDPRNAILKELARGLARSAKDGDGYLFAVWEEVEKVMSEEKKLFANADFFSACFLPFHGGPYAAFHPHLCAGSGDRLVGAYQRAASQQQADSPGNA